MRLDLHCHSTRSDGSLEPGAVAGMAGEFGVELFCLTDHDTVAGFDETRAALPTSCVVMRGLELSCKYGERTVHLLMYGVDDGDSLLALQRRLDQVRADREDRLRRIVARLADLRIELDLEDLLAKTEGKTPGRPHIAQAMVEAGAVPTVRDAFTRYLHDGGPADVQLERISLEEGLGLGLATGAKMSLAHPHTQRSPALVEKMFADYREAGLEGIEAWYGGYDKGARKGWTDLASRQGLVVTGGSDFHGDVVPNIKSPGIELPDAVAGPLRDWLDV
jgi:predicted metal-dependent phosphoesterase TrpH